MRESIPTIVLQGFCLWISVQAFGPEAPPSHYFARSRSPAIFRAKIHSQTSLLQRRQQQQQQQLSSLFLSGEDNGGEAPKRRRKRVKRKEAVDEEEEEEEEDEPTLEIKQREDGPVNMQVQDVRNLVGRGAGGGAAPKVSEAATTSSSSTRSMDASPSVNTPAYSSSGSSDSLSPDSLQMLLEDAKEFQAMEEKKDNSVAASMGDEEEGFKMPDSFRNTLSTIVTIDFFIICGFLLWFLAGIFCSYILKDDTVQIAFNQLFQPVVQPALGVLMIGAIAGSFGNEEDQENV